MNNSIVSAFTLSILMTTAAAAQDADVKLTLQDRVEQCTTLNCMPVASCGTMMGGYFEGDVTNEDALYLCGVRRAEEESAKKLEGVTLDF